MRRRESYANNPNWYHSLGEKLDKHHYRNGNWHAECDKHTGNCSEHYDRYDPHKSGPDLIRHMWDSNLGKAVIIGAVACGVSLAAYYLDKKR